MYFFALSLSEEEQKKALMFEIIKQLHTAQFSGKRYLNYDDIINALQIDQTTLVNSLNVLENHQFIRKLNLAVKLEERAMRIMTDFNPRTFDEFVARYNNPERPYGEPVRMEGYKKSMWKKLKTPITIGGSIASILGFIYILTIIWNNTP